MKKILLCVLLLTTAGAVLAQATRDSRPVKVRITPTKMSWDYTAGETLKMEVAIEKNELPLSDITFRYGFGPEMLDPVVSKEAAIKKGSITLDLGKLDKPGFYTLNVSVEVDGAKYDQWKTIGVDRDKIEPTVKMPADFEAWWKKQTDADRKAPLEGMRRLLPERCTDKVNVYEISYRYTPQGGRMYGILCVPAAPGKYPAVLKVPGAGVRAYAGSVDLAAKGVITLEVGIHGVPVTLDPKVYDNLRNGALQGYPTMNVESREKYYYNKVYRGCRRAVDYLFSLEEFDGVNIAVSGGSQGGALSVIVAALDERIVCANSQYPALSDMTGYLHGRAGGWPHILRNPKGNVYNKPEYIETLSYYDVVNFARILKTPIRYTMGYNDKVCPPTSTFSVYNATRAPKELNVVYEVAHWLYLEDYAAIDAYLEKMLKK